MLVPLDARMWVHEPVHLGLGRSPAPVVLGFEADRFTPALHLRDHIPAADLRPFEQFFLGHAEALHFTEDHPPVALPESDANRVRHLAWLSATLRAPVSYWHHEGDHGLRHEYVWGFRPDAPPTTWFNESQVVRDAASRPDPASGFTAALWHLGVRCPNRDETSWMHDVSGFRLLTERPFTP